MGELTRYQKLLVENIELKHNCPAKDLLTDLRNNPPLRFSNIAVIVGCSVCTLRVLFKHFGVDKGKNVVLDRRSIFPNATKLFKKFSTPEDAVVHCRDKLKLTVWETSEKLGISESSVVKYTPDWLKYTYNMSQGGLQVKQETGRKTSVPQDHPWNEPF